MSDRKSQHFVPQFYLRNFAVEGTARKVALYNITSGRFVHGAAIKSQACEDNFYQDLEIEAALGDLEDATACIIRDAITHGTLPKRFTEGHHVLLLFVLLQAARTPAAVECMTSALNDLWRSAASDLPGVEEHAGGLEASLRTSPGLLLQVATANYPLALDLRWKLLLNRTSLPFITCDHPAVSYNQFLEPRAASGGTTGLVARGLQTFLPLSPRHLLVLFDSQTYKVGGRGFRATGVEITDEEDVDGLNLLQAVNADDTLFSDDKATEAYLKQLARRADKHRRGKSPTIRRQAGVGPDGTAGDLCATSLADIRTGLKIRPIKILPSAAARPPDARLVQARDTRLLHLFDLFQMDVQAGRYKQTHFGKWLRDRFGEAEPS